MPRIQVLKENSTSRAILASDDSRALQCGPSTEPRRGTGYVTCFLSRLSVSYETSIVPIGYSRDNRPLPSSGHVQPHRRE